MCSSDLGADTFNGGGKDDIIGGGDSSLLTTTPDTAVGGNGFDWITYTTGTYGLGKTGVNADLSLGARAPGDLVQAAMDIFPDGDVEGLSGGTGNDTLAGDLRTTLVNPVGTNDTLDATGLAKIAGLSSLVSLGSLVRRALSSER